MIWRLSATSNPTAATGISTKYGYVLSFVSGLLLMCTPPSPKTRWRRLCVERVASREVINSGGGKRRGKEGATPWPDCTPGAVHLRLCDGFVTCITSDPL